MIESWPGVIAAKASQIDMQAARRCLGRLPLSGLELACLTPTCSDLCRPVRPQSARRLKKAAASQAADRTSQRLVQNLLRQEAMRAVLGAAAPLPLAVAAAARPDPFALPPAPPVHGSVGSGGRSARCRRMGWGLGTANWLWGGMDSLSEGI